MDDVYSKIAELTVQFNAGDEENWRALYEPLYGQPSKAVRIFRDERYGPAERNRLDVFVPVSELVGRPVIMFVHGGGFYSGDKAWSEKCWANIGDFFARSGIVTVIVNHQLVPHVQYPGGADDIQLAREWIYNNIAAKRYGNGCINKVVLFGHSSGGAHIASNLYAAGDPNRNTSTTVFPPVAGVIYLDVPFWFDSRKPVRERILTQYFGSSDEGVWGPISPLGLFQRLPEDSPFLNSNEIPTYVGTVKWEVKETADAAVAFLNAYRERSKPAGTLPIFNVVDKHNHLSNVLSIGTTDDTQSKVLLDFIHSCIARKSGQLGKSRARI